MALLKCRIQNIEWSIPGNSAQCPNEILNRKIWWETRLKNTFLSLPASSVHCLCSTVQKHKAFFYILACHSFRPIVFILYRGRDIQMMKTIYRTRDSRTSCALIYKSIQTANVLFKNFSNDLDKWRYWS